jgi:Glyoxalase/Bleomycin resistance protein/Dioxygenase superfamily
LGKIPTTSVRRPISRFTRSSGLVRELAAVRRELDERGVRILREPKREPWGLLEMWIADPDGVRICIVEVPEEHPLRYRG